MFVHENENLFNIFLRRSLHGTDATASIGARQAILHRHREECRINRSGKEASASLPGAAGAWGNQLPFQVRMEHSPFIHLFHH